MSQVYDNSVWWENVDRALLNMFKGIYIIKTEKGVQTKVPIPVEFFPLNMNTKKYTYPMVMIRHQGETFDIDRYDPNPIKVSQVDGKAIYEDSAIPYKLHYQIDIATEKQRDMNNIMKQIITMFRPRGLIKVVDDGGNERNCYYSYVAKPIHQLDYYAVRGEDRLLRTVILFDVNVEVDSGEQREVRIVTKNPIINQ